MKKIFIIGSVASGKTTLARNLSRHTHINWYELDQIVYHKTEIERYKRSGEEQKKVILEIDETGQWIFEGVNRSSYDFLFEMADSIIWIDPPLWKRKILIFIRYLKQNLGLETCHYKSDINMLRMMYKWLNDFELERNDFELNLEKYSEKVIIMKTINEGVLER